jgi:hypothetical protein
VTSAGRRTTGWEVAAAAVVAVAVVARIHNAFAYPPLLDFDGPAHALSVFSFHEARLPDPRTWAGFHPPLYYALGAALWRVAPEAMPVHTLLRLLSAAVGFGALAITWRTLRRFVPPADAAVTAALVAGAPVFALATSMLGNETTCTLFATAALARLCAVPADPARAARHATGTALLAALAGLAKSTGLGVVAVTALAYASRLRRDPAHAARVLAATIGLPLVLLTPHYGRLLMERGSLVAVISGGAPADAQGSEMSAQPPGERRLSDYFVVPPAALLAPAKEAPGMVRSVPGLLYASTWADGHGQFLPAQERPVLAAAAASALLGLLPTALFARGLVRVVRQRRAFAAAGPAFGFGALLLAAFLVQTSVVPRYSAVKASYLLPALLPAAIALAVGLSASAGTVRAVLRAALLGIAAGMTALTWYGWWR